MSGELYVAFFSLIGAYVVVTVWQRTADERRIQELARAERREAERRGGAARATGVVRE